MSLFTEYLDRKGFDATAIIKSPLMVKRLDDAPVARPLAWLYQWRQSLESRIQLRFSPQTSAVLVAVVLGNSRFLERSVAERFRDGGTFHLLVISGFHISVVGGGMLWLVRRFTNKRYWQLLLSLMALWSYALVVGAEASVIRAATMFTIVELGWIFHRRATSLNALGGTTLGLLVHDPRDLFDPSFQLTFLSVLAIVTLALPLLTRLSQIGTWHPSRECPYPPNCTSGLRHMCEGLFWREKKWREDVEEQIHSYKLFKVPVARSLERCQLQWLLRYAFSGLIVSLSVQLLLLPLMVLYFHRLSPAAFVLNLIVGATMGLMICAAVMSMVLAEVSVTLALPFTVATDLLNWLMVHSVDPLTAVQVASYRLPEYSGWKASIYGVYYLPLIALAVSLSRWVPLCAPTKRKPRGAGTPFVHILLLIQTILVAIAVFHPFSERETFGRLRVDFLDVGQGDAALITAPDGTRLLVDGGGQPSFSRTTQHTKDQTSFSPDMRGIGEAVVSEFLWWMGLDHVDYLLATHADADHIDGLSEVARNFRVRAALVARHPRNDPEFVRFAETLAVERIPITLVGLGDTLRFGPLTVQIVWPVAGAGQELASGNNDSIVLLIQLGDRSILLTGDLEMRAEKALLRQGLDLTSAVVKVAHHGSRTSSSAEFVALTKADLAVISVGQMSIFGHPHAEVVERWQAIGAQVLTTGDSGTITVTTDGTDLEVSRYSK